MSIGTFVQPTKAVVTEEYEIEYRDKSIFKELYRLFGLSGFQRQEPNQQVSNQIVPHKRKAFDGDTDGKNQASSYGEISV